MRYIKVIAVLLSLVVCVGVTGCFSARAKDIEAFIKPWQADVNAVNYILHPPDEIEIHCVKVPELNLHRQQIRPDGKVSFEALGEIAVAGKTCGQVSEILRKKALALYSLKGDNPIDVRVSTYASKVYYVVGEVRKPGPKLYTGRNDLLTAVVDATIEITAWEEKIQVIRPSAEEGKEPKIFQMNLKKMIKHGDTTKNVLLQEGDIVYVPPTVLAAIGNVIAELVRPVGLALSPALTAMRISEGGY